MHRLTSQKSQYFDSWLSDLLQSELKMKLLEVEGACAPVLYSWRRHWWPSLESHRLVLLLITFSEAEILFC